MRLFGRAALLAGAATAGRGAGSVPLTVQLASLAGVFLLLLGLLQLLLTVARRVLPLVDTGISFERSLLLRLVGPARLVALATGLAITLANIGLRHDLENGLVHAAVIFVIIGVSWFLVRSTYVFEDVVLARNSVDIADNLHARKLRTQIHVLRRVAVVAVIVVAISVILLSFSEVRAAGAGLLASAGVIGIVVGFAAQSSVSNLVAGLQIAISQPIRVDDVVVVDGHWGRVEEINLTYVVVRVWDLRRLIIPISVLMTGPFENWTRHDASILGWVHIEVDYRAPIPAIREKFHQILQASEEWDGEVWTLQVTGAGVSTLQLRALMSSPDSSLSWNLQCKVREELVAFLQAEYPEALPRVRAEIEPVGGQVADAPRDRGDRGDSATGRSRGGAGQAGSAAVAPDVEWLPLPDPMKTKP